MSEDVEVDYSTNLPKIQPMNVSATATQNAMAKTLSASDIDILKVGEPGVLLLPGADVNIKEKPERQQRVLQWYLNVIKNPDWVSGRGKSFEGLIAAAFGGVVNNNEHTENKSDVDVPIINQDGFGRAEGYGISVKFTEKKPEKDQLLGGVVKGVNKQLQDDEEIKKLLNVDTITSKNIGVEFNKLINSEIGREFMKKSLNRPDTFGPIDYFMFSTKGNNNQILIYQYKKYDIINHIADDNFGFNSVGSIEVKFLNNLPSIDAKIVFPEYTSSSRYKYRWNRDGVEISFTPEKTLAINVTKALGNEFFLVGQVFREYSNGEIKYTFNQVLDRDELNRKITIENNVRLESIAKAISLDIAGLDYNNKSPKFKNFVKILENYKEMVSKKLFNSKAKLSDKGREAAFQNLFGDRGHTINPFAIQTWKKNPRKFVGEVLKMFGCDADGVNYIEQSIRNVFNVDIQLPLSQYCDGGNNPQPEAVQESVNKVLKTLNEAIEKKK
jgi:hypothetical protein